MVAFWALAFLALEAFDCFVDGFVVSRSGPFGLSNRWLDGGFSLSFNAVVAVVSSCLWFSSSFDVVVVVVVVGFAVCDCLSPRVGCGSPGIHA